MTDEHKQAFREWPCPKIGDVVHYCVSGISRNYPGKGKVLSFLGHVWGNVCKYRVTYKKETIVVRTPDIDKIYRSKKLIWKRPSV